MKEKNKTTIVAAIIGAIATIAGSVIGNNYAQGQQNQYIESQISNIEGDNNNVTINNVNDLVNEYNNLLSENETLKAKNTSYYNNLTDTKNKLESMEGQISNIPQITYNSLGLIVDVQDVSINKNNSMITVDGREYFSKEIVEKLLPDSKKITFKDGNMYVGTVVAEKANLTEFWRIEEHYYSTKNSVTDSYGNTRNDCIILNGGVYDYGNVTYNIGGKYSMLQITLSVGHGTSSDEKASFYIKTDDEVVYSYENLSIQTEPFTIEVPINNCTKLKLGFSGAQYFDCVVSKAIVYNE